MTNEERQRTCNYCNKTFPTRTAFASHWKKCPVRIKAGYIENPSPSASEGWIKLKANIA